MENPIIFYSHLSSSGRLHELFHIPVVIKERTQILTQIRFRHTYIDLNVSCARRLTFGLALLPTILVKLETSLSHGPGCKE